MKKFISGCAGIIAVVGIVLFIVHDCTRKPTPPPPEISADYTGPREKHEKLDKRALPFFAGRYGAIVRYGDTTITWQKWRGQWRKIYYAERRRLGNSPYSTYKVYNEAQDMIQESEQFQEGMITGWLLDYDDKGMLIKAYNQNADFDFTIDDLIKKIKDEYDADLTKQLTNGQYAERYKVSGHPVRKYRLCINSGPNKWRLEIDGHDGHKIKKRIIYDD